MYLYHVPTNDTEQIAVQDMEVISKKNKYQRKHK